MRVFVDDGFQIMLEIVLGAKYRAFAAVGGAGGHCEPLAVGVRDARVFDWLESRL